MRVRGVIASLITVSLGTLFKQSSGNCRQPSLSLTQAQTLATQPDCAALIRRVMTEGLEANLLVCIGCEFSLQQSQGVSGSIVASCVDCCVDAQLCHCVGGPGRCFLEDC